mmetsp:Transcript_11738/g.36316  ORF Transcript_11738/g.36316 Transcript_11738/m.36316 type:complete len:121 (-) Transcript_11738:49-411(-)|eukprot:scaffold81935_cov34-Tisochrysis_lutea.AAC.1
MRYPPRLSPFAPTTPTDSAIDSASPRVHHMHNPRLTLKRTQWRTRGCAAPENLAALFFSLRSLVWLERMKARCDTWAFVQNRYASLIAERRLASHPTTTPCCILYTCVRENVIANLRNKQ